MLQRRATVLLARAEFSLAVDRAGAARLGIQGPAVGVAQFRVEPAAAVQAAAAQAWAETAAAVQPAAVQAAAAQVWAETAAAVQPAAAWAAAAQAWAETAAAVQPAAAREWAAREVEAWAVAVRVARLWVEQLPAGVRPTGAPVQTAASGRAELVGLSVRVLPRGRRATPCAEA
jgi:hypothetical protein